MKFLATPGAVTARMQTLLVSVALVLGSAVPAIILTAPAHASHAKVLHNDSTTTTARHAAPGLDINKLLTGNGKTVSRSNASDVYHVGKSFVGKKKAQCRHSFSKPRKRRICEKAQGARAVATKYLVTQYRSKYFYIKWHSNARLAKKCRHHHHWCAHTRKFRFMTIGNCGAPWAPPKWHFRYACLNWRAGQYRNRWSNLAFFRKNTVPLATTDLLRLASAKIGPNQKPGVSMSHHFSFFGGPYEGFKLNRAATVQAHNQVDLADGSLVLANALCVGLGFVSKSKMLAAGCSSYVTAAIEGVKNDINQAYAEGKCVQFKLYYLYVLPGPIGPIVSIRQGLDATVVVSC